jgi:UDP:flavonoid glycosyltransferase YjiC (YdhE family)
MNKNQTKSKKLVGFFPSFLNLAETGRAVVIAKRFRELGGNVIFFSHGGRYEFLARENDFKIVKVNPNVTEEYLKEYFKIISLETFNSKIIDENFIFENVKGEVDAFKKTKIKLLVSTNNLTCALSARALKIPYININPDSGLFYLKIPDTLENPFTFFIPQALKVRILNWLLLNSKMYLKNINKVASRFNIPPFKSALDLYDGDITLVSNYLEFVNIFPNQQAFPKENYIGISSIDELFKINESTELNNQIKTHLKKTGKSILVSLGSSGSKELFIKIIKTLNKTNYNIIGIYTSVLKREELPNVNDNILLIEFVPSISKVTENVDLAIIHGGQGTIFTTIYAKKPIIGFPMHIEQHINLEKIVGHGCGLMLSRKFYSEKKLLKTIDIILNNYENYLANIKNLVDKLPKPEGDIKAAQKIFEIFKKINN